MSKNKIISIALVLLLLFVFIGCEMGGTGPAADDDDPPIIEVPDPKDLVLTDYSVATLADLLPFTPAVSENESIEGWPTDSLERDMMAMAASLGIFEEALSLIENGEITSFTPIASRSISAGLQLQIKDEGFQIDFNDPPRTYSKTFIDHLDLFLEGGISSLSSLIAFAEFDADDIAPALSMDGRIQISGKMRNITDKMTFGTVTAEDFAGVVSLFVDLSIDGTNMESETPTGLLSGRVLFSGGSSVQVEYGPENTLHNVPVVLQLELAPFTDVNIAALLVAIETEAEAAQTETRNPNYWGVVAPIMWPGETGNLLTITRIIGNHNATTVLDTRTWTNTDAFNLIFSLIELVSAD